jgi:hypothetical protein
MRVIRSAGQNVSPSDDGRLYDQIFTDGLFEDATVTALGGNNIALSALYGVICGRDFTAEAQTINATLPEADTASGYIYVEIDTSSDDIITIGTALAPFTPTYENINTNGAVAQMVIATYEASAVAVTSVTATYAKASAGGVGSLATIEASPATSNYSVGSFLVYNGTLYKVTRAIAAGEALVVGTNISATTAGAELTSLNNGLTSIKTLDDFIGYKDRTVSNISISSDNGYASLGNVYTDWGLPSGAYVLGFYVRGWSVSPGTFSLASSSDGRVLYVISTKAGTIGQLTIRVWYAKF